MVAYLISKGVGNADSVFPYKSTGTKPSTCVICYSDRAIPAAQAMATYEVDMSILIRSTGAVDVDETPSDIIDANVDIVDKVFDAIHAFGNDAQSGGNLADEITSAARTDGISEFTCLNVEILSHEVDIEQQAESWTDTYTLRLIVSSADVS